MSAMGELLNDLRAEGEALDGIVAALPEARWRTPTPAAGWTVAHQISHLTWTDEMLLLAARDPDGFRESMLARFESGQPVVDDGARDGARLPPGELLARWRRSRREVLDTLTDRTETIPWVGTVHKPMSAATGRLMETWAHGQDVADAVDVAYPVTGRLRHVCHLGVATRNHAFTVHGSNPPPDPFRVELAPPAGAGGNATGPWTWGPAGAGERVVGPALGFALLVTRRRHRSECGLRAEGALADRWLDIAQAFAGDPGPARRPRSLRSDDPDSTDADPTDADPTVPTDPPEPGATGGRGTVPRAQAVRRAGPARR